jgi:hypothetical protein
MARFCNNIETQGDRVAMTGGFYGVTSWLPPQPDPFGQSLARQSLPLPTGDRGKGPSSARWSGPGTSLAEAGTLQGRKTSPKLLLFAPFGPITDPRTLVPWFAVAAYCKTRLCVLVEKLKPLANLSVMV